jgi:hypothetical protein
MTTDYKMRIAEAQDKIVVACFGITNMTFPYHLFGKPDFPHLGVFDSSLYYRCTPAQEIVEAALERYRELQKSYTDMYTQYAQRDFETVPIIKQPTAAEKKQATY